jgi:hypothetical protein
MKKMILLFGGAWLCATAVMAEKLSFETTLIPAEMEKDIGVKVSGVKDFDSATKLPYGAVHEINVKYTTAKDVFWWCYDKRSNQFLKIFFDERIEKFDPTKKYLVAVKYSESEEEWGTHGRRGCKITITAEGSAK